MRRVDLPFEDLRPVAAHAHLGGGDARVRRRRERRRLEFRHLVGRPHVAPHEAAGLARRIGLVLHALRNRLSRPARRPSRPRCRRRRTSSRDRGSAARIPRCARRRARRGDAGSIRRARRAGPWCRGTPPGSRRAAARAAASPSGSATSSRQARRDPVAAHDLPHRRVALDAAEQIVFFRRHGVPRASAFCRVSEVSLMRTRGRVELGEPDGSCASASRGWAARSP